MRVWFIGIALFISLTHLYSIGVKAATTISNQAVLFYEMDNQTFKITSNKIEYMVDQLIDVKLKWLDNIAVNVDNSLKDATLSFKITNTGNGEDRFKLILQPSILNGLELYDCKIAVNDEYIVDIVLKSDESALLDVVCSVLDRQFLHNSFEIVLKAISTRGGSGIAGKIHKSKGVNGVDAIDGLKGGVDSVSGKYILVNKEALSLKKSAVLKGSTITYKIVLTAQKDKVIKDILFSDQIPDATEYIKGSLRLNNKSLSDDFDYDSGGFDILKNRVVVNIDSLRYPNQKSIEFSVKLK